MTDITSYKCDLYHRSCMNKPMPVNHDAMLDYIVDGKGDIIVLRCDACGKTWRIVENSEE